jgi:hypothetical protein
MNPLIADYFERRVTMGCGGVQYLDREMQCRLSSRDLTGDPEVTLVVIKVGEGSQPRLCSDFKIERNVEDIPSLRPAGAAPSSRLCGLVVIQTCR